MLLRPSFASALGQRIVRPQLHHSLRSSPCTHGTSLLSTAMAARSYSSMHNSFYLRIIPTCRSNKNTVCIFNSSSMKQKLSTAKRNHYLNRYNQNRLLSSPSSNASPPPQATTTVAKKSKSKSLTTTANLDSTCIKTEFAQLHSEIAQLSYLIKQTSSQQLETQALSRRAEARAYIIENKLIDIQKYVVKIPALENVTQNLRQYLKDYSPTYFSNVFQKVNQSSAASYLINKYTIWMLFGGAVLIWQYRKTMYQQTSEEIANVASLTLQQDSLRETIQDTLTTVANSPETLASLSALFQGLIREERTERHLIDLLVRALKSEGVRDAAFYLLDLCFQDPALQVQAGEFLKAAAHATVLDEGVQKSTGVGIQQALKSAVLPRWAKNTLGAPPLRDGSNKIGENAIGAGGSTPDEVTISNGNS